MRERERKGIGGKRVMGKKGAGKMRLECKRAD